MNNLISTSVLETVKRQDEHHIERHAAFLRRIKEGPIGLLFLGDSLTRRWAEVPWLWERYFAKYHPANFGVGSDTTQNLKWRILHGELEGINPGAVVLLIGTNNLPLHNEAEIAAAITDIVTILHQKLPETKLILMGLLPRDADDSSRDYLRSITAINRELHKLAGLGYVKFLDIGDKFKDCDGKVNRTLMPDGLHMVEPGYEIWGEFLLPFLEAYMPKS
jgi:platelet-activating factor acetylhydrolase IB subunit beta/gamma